MSGESPADEDGPEPKAWRVVVVVVVGLLPAVWFGHKAWEHLGYAGGFRGETGTLTVDACDREPHNRSASGRRRHPVFYCRGRFRRSTAGSAPADVRLETHGRPEGAVVRVRRTADGAVHTAANAGYETAEFLGLAVGFLGLGTAVAALGTAGTGRTVRRAGVALLAAGFAGLLIAIVGDTLHDPVQLVGSRPPPRP